MTDVFYLPVILLVIAAYFLSHLCYALLTLLYPLIRVRFLITSTLFLIPSGRLAMSDNGLPPALTEVLACLDLISRRLRARVAHQTGRVGPFPTNSLRLVPAWPAADPAGPPPEPVAGPSRTVMWWDPLQLPHQGLGQSYGPIVPFQGQEPCQGPAMPAQGRDPFYNPVPQSQEVPVPQFPDPGQYTVPPAPLQDPPGYYGLHDVIPAVTPVGEVILGEGEVAGDKLEQVIVEEMPNAEYGNLRAILWRNCGCGWGCRTTYKGLRMHQAKASCGWDSDLSRTTIRSTRATRPTWSPRTPKGCDGRDYRPSHPATRSSSPAVLCSATTAASPRVEQASIEGCQDAPPAQ